MDLKTVIGVVETFTPQVILDQIKADLANLPDEAAAKAKVEALVEAEINKIAPVSFIEAEINACLPGAVKIITPIAEKIENVVIPRIEVKLVTLVTNFVFAEADKVLGAGWFAALKAAVAPVEPVTPPAAQ